MLRIKQHTTRLGLVLLIALFGAVTLANPLTAYATPAPTHDNGTLVSGWLANAKATHDSAFTSFWGTAPVYGSDDRVHLYHNAAGLRLIISVCDATQTCATTFTQDQTTSYRHRATGNCFRLTSTDNGATWSAFRTCADSDSLTSSGYYAMWNPTSQPWDSNLDAVFPANGGYAWPGMAFWVDPVAPDAPLLTLDGDTLSWSAPTDADSYKVFNDGTQVASGVNVTSAPVSDFVEVVCDTMYTLTVKATNEVGDSPASNSVEYVQPCPAPSPQEERIEMLGVGIACFMVYKISMGFRFRSPE